MVMCHLDIHTKNIAIDAWNIVWILDWERAGGYPIFFEEARLSAGRDQKHQDFTMELLKTMSNGS
jgi:thiamine kinase-like enzyme